MCHNNKSEFQQMSKLHLPRALFPLSALALATSLAASPALAETLNIGVQGELASFDTSQVSGGVWESQVLMDVYEGLLKQSPDGELLPGMATEWEVSDDGKTYTFHMREGAKWSDGEPVTAEDFVFGWQHLLAPENASKYAYMLYPIVNAEAINTGDKKADTLGAESLDGGKTLKVTLDHPTPYFLQLLTHYTSYPVPKHLVDEYGKDWVKLDHIASNGAFKPVDWVSQSRISVEKNPAYYDADEVSLDGVNYYTVEDRNAGISRFRAGELDVLTDYPSSRYQWLTDNLPDATHMSPMLGSYYYVLNNRDGNPTADKRVREALNLAIRRNVLSEQIMAGSFKASTAMVPPGTSHYDAQQMDLGSDDMNDRMARAKELLKEAGYGPDHPLELREGGLPGLNSPNRPPVTHPIGWVGPPHRDRRGSPNALHGPPCPFRGPPGPATLPPSWLRHRETPLWAGGHRSRCGEILPTD